MKLTHSIKKQVTLFSTILLFSVALILICVFFLFYKTYYFKSIEESYDQIAYQNFSNIEYKLDHFQNIITSLSINTTIKDILCDTTSDPISKGIILNNEVSSFVSNLYSDYIFSPIIYPENGNIIYGSSYIKNIEAATESKWYKNYLNNGICVHFEDGNLNNHISLIQPIYSLNENMIFSERIATIKMDIIMEQFLPSISEDYDIVVCDYEDNIVFSSSDLSLPEITTYTSSKNMFHYEDNKHPVYFKKYLNEQLSIYYIFDYQTVNKAFYNTIFMSVILTLALFLIMSFCIIKYGKNKLARLEFVSKKMQQAGTGDWYIKESLTGDDELSLLDGQLNNMIVQINKLVSEKYTLELEKKNAQLQALQMQINPHFLYNTLDTINQLALSVDAPEVKKISVIMQNLGTLFRYSISDSKSMSVRLSQELEYIKVYLAIQNIRFDNKFEIFFDIDPKTQDCSILKFILQPMAENAIKYSSQNHPSYIEFYTHIEDDNLIITVQDDGIGMSPETLEQVLTTIDENNTSIKSIGLRNVQHRIKLYYGNEYGMSIESKKNLGTKITLKIPAIYDDYKTSINPDSQ